MSGDKTSRGAPVRAFFTLWLALLFTPLVLAQSDLITKARELLDAKQAEAAYQLLIKESEQYAGNPNFDLLLGIAALEARHPTQAVFALERVLAVDPNNERARLELGRAYFQMNENEAAQQEFSAAKGRTLPPETAKAVDEYLTAIESRIAATKRRIELFIEGAVGYDSNVNSATDLSTVAIPALGNLVFTLDRTGQEMDSGFFEVGAGFNFQSRFLDRDDLRIYGGADIHFRTPFDEPDFATTIANGRVGLRFGRERNAFLVSLLGQKYYLDEDKLNATRDMGGISAQWLHAYSQRTQFSVFGQASIQRFPDQHVRDVNQFVGGAGIVHAMQAQGDPIVYLSAFGGVDDERFDAFDHIGRWFAGVRTGGQYTLNQKTALFASLSYQHSRYGADDPLFLERREDDFFFARVGLDYNLTRNWTVRPEVQYSNNDSTLPISDFDRWQTLVTIRNRW